MQYVQYQHINFSAWDACVANSEVVNPFMYSWSLNALTNQWDAIIWGNYEAVFPLPYRKKWGLIKYLYQVPHLHALSIMHNELISVDYEAFFTLINKQFYFFHFDIDTASIPNKYLYKKRAFQQLSLQATFDFLYENFSKSCKKNIRQAQAAGVVFSENENITLTVKNYNNAYGKYQHKYSQKAEQQLIHFIEKAIENNKILSLKATDASTSRLLSTAFFILEKNVIFYWYAAPTQEGRKVNITYLLLYEIIKRYANKATSLHFMGSDIENVANFYQQFNPTISTYFQVKKMSLL